jgi:hypothetical protein
MPKLHFVIVFSQKKLFVIILRVCTSAGVVPKVFKIMKAGRCTALLGFGPPQDLESEKPSGPPQDLESEKSSGQFFCLIVMSH